MVGGAAVADAGAIILRAGTGTGEQGEKVRIDSSGDVGIGTDDPTTKLVINGDWVSSTGQLKIKPSSAGQTLSGFTLAGQDDTLLATVYAHSSSNFLAIQTNDASGSIRFSGPSLEHLRIGSDGQIGLGGANYGSTGQVLTSNGASSAPTWQDASGGDSLDVTASLFI